jgi:CHASE2 domain-containing sensor protein
MAAVVGGLGTSGFARMLRVPVAPDGAAGAPLRLLGKTAFQVAAGLVIALFLLLTYSAAVTGIITAWREHDWRVLLLCILMASYFVAATGALGVVRLKLPAIPFYLAFTGLGADWWLRRRDQGRRAPTLTAAVTE